MRRDAPDPRRSTRRVLGPVRAMRPVMALMAASSAGALPADDCAPDWVSRVALQDARTARISSWDRTGGNNDFLVLKPGQTYELADIRGPGCVKHVYCTYIIGDDAVRESFFRNLILRAYWDDEKTPSVECPIGDFFGVSNARPRPIRSLDLVVNPGAEGLATSFGLNCYFPMPFGKRARFEVTYDAEPGSADAGGFWYHIDYETYRRAPAWMARAGRFHAQFRHRRLTAATGLNGINLDGKDNYVILDAAGQGHLAGYVLGVDNLVGGWWGEGDDMVFVDGETWPPSFHGTGTEEIFAGGACPDVEYTGPYTGFHLVENLEGDQWYGKTGMYRLFARDPIRFKKQLRVAIEHGHANDMANDYSSVAYWYQREPHAPFPELPGRSERKPVSVYPAQAGEVPGAVEAEGLQKSAQTGGGRLAAIRFAGEWSRGRFLWYIGNGEGDYVTVKVPVAEPGEYEVAVWMARASDFGVVQASVDGTPLGAPFDGYNGDGGHGPTHVARAADVRLGRVRLDAGEHAFEFRLTGKNPAATGYMVGVDCIRLRPAK